MDTHDAEQLMMPFFPNDPYLAIQSLARAMFDNDGVEIPEWIWEAVVQQYFTYLEIRRIKMKQSYARTQLSAEDPFNIKTIPYVLLERLNMN